MMDDAGARLRTLTIALCVVCVSACIALWVPARAQAAPSITSSEQAALSLSRVLADVGSAQRDVQLANLTGARSQMRSARRALQQVRVNLSSDGQQQAAASAFVMSLDRQLIALTDAVNRGAQDDVVRRYARLRGDIHRFSAMAAVNAAQAARTGDARAWLLLRDFPAPTRFSRTSTAAIEALAAIDASAMKPKSAATIVRNELLDGAQHVMRDALTDTDVEHSRGLTLSAIAAIERAYGAWSILRPTFVHDRGAAAATAIDALFERVRANDARATEVTDALRGWVAAPLAAADRARRGAQLIRFLDLVPVEYERGVRDGKVTNDIEIHEAVTFRDAAAMAWGDLEDVAIERNPHAADEVRAELADLASLLERAVEGDRAPDAGQVSAAAGRASRAVHAALPKSWLRADSGTDLLIVSQVLDRVDRLIATRSWSQAEQARIEAYALFEFGPELRLRAIDPALALRVEGLIWFGDSGTDGYATLISRHASTAETQTTRRVLDDALAKVDERIAKGTSKASFVTNAAVIVFREGMEAVLILAALIASFVGASSSLRRPVLAGAGLALVASAATFVAAGALLGSLAAFGERLEAIVSIVAIAVLLLILNWFFHKVYWNDWMAGFHQKKQQLVGSRRQQQAAIVEGRPLIGRTQMIGLLALGFTSIYREGFETVLFLQALVLEAGTSAVLEGVALGLVGTAALAVLTIALQRRLPYKRMLIVTGVLISVVLMTMVGNTVRTMQGVGWSPVHVIAGMHVPSWAGTWLGVHPTWETIGAQVLALGYVFGSYALAEAMHARAQRRRLASRAAPRADAAVAAAAAAPPAPPADERELTRV